MDGQGYGMDGGPLAAQSRTVKKLTSIMVLLLKSRRAFLTMHTQNQLVTTTNAIKRLNRLEQELENELEQRSASANNINGPSPIPIAHLSHWAVDRTRQDAMLQMCSRRQLSKAAAELRSDQYATPDLSPRAVTWLKEASHRLFSGRDKSHSHSCANSLQPAF